MRELKDYTSWDELTDMAVGQVLHYERLDDEDGEEVAYLMLRGTTGLCAYLGLRETHPLVKMAPHYDDLKLGVHGDLTFAGVGDGNIRPAGWFWWGWDYSHAFDALLFDRKTIDRLAIGVMNKERRWMPLDVWQDSQTAIFEFIDLAKSARASP